MAHIQIRASNLANFNACPYKFHNDKYSIDQRITYFGTILHFLLRNDSVKEEMLSYYYNNINPDLKLERIGHKLVENGKKFIESIDGEKLEEFPMLYKLPFGYDDTYWLEGTADLVVITSSGNIEIYDYKTTNSASWYTGDDIWVENPQGKIYSFLAGQIFKVDKIKFTYVVLEKNNSGRISTFSKEYDLKQIEKEVLDLAERYIDSEIMENYEATPCRLCNFCKFLKDGTCPAHKIDVEINLPGDGPVDF